MLQREYEAWTADLEAIPRQYEAMSADELAEALAHTLEKRGCMLKLVCMNLYDMEGNSRMENLVAFKTVYAGAMKAVTCCLNKFFPHMTAADIQGFLYAFFPFLFGVYPYTMVTEKQKQAMELARVSYPRYSVYEITKSFAAKLLQAFQ